MAGLERGHVLGQLPSTNGPFPSERCPPRVLRLRLEKRACDVQKVRLGVNPCAALLREKKCSFLNGKLAQVPIDFLRLVDGDQAIWQGSDHGRRQGRSRAAGAGFGLFYAMEASGLGNPLLLGL